MAAAAAAAAAAGLSPLAYVGASAASGLLQGMMQNLAAEKQIQFQRDQLRQQLGWDKEKFAQSQEANLAARQAQEALARQQGLTGSMERLGGSEAQYGVNQSQNLAGLASILQRTV